LWHGRFEIHGDGISYLDIGDAFARGDFANAVNAYWSPLYAWTLGAALAVSPLPRESEYLVVAGVNFAAYLFALVGFTGLLGELRVGCPGLAAGCEPFRLPEAVWLVLGYLVFIWTATAVSRIWYVTPDMTLSGIVYLCSLLVLRARRLPASWGPAIGLGAAVGVGYLVKAPMAVLGLIFLGCFALAIGRWKVAVPRVGVAAAIAVVIAAPYVAIISAEKGRVTIGESGRLNVAWQMNGVPHAFWQGPPPGYGMPRHPPRQIHASPDAFEFATPFAVTYPIWFDPSYWLDGIEPRFSVDRLDVPLGAFARVVKGIVRSQIVFWSALVALVAVGCLRSGWMRDAWRLFPLWIPACAALAMYSVLWTVPRYIASFVALLTVGAIFTMRQFVDDRRRLRRASTTLVLVMCVSMPVALAVRFVDPPPADDTVRSSVKVARCLEQLDVRPGDRIAFVRAGGSVYFARLARVSIVAEISQEAFWSARPEERRSVLAAMAGTGAEVVVTAAIPPHAVDAASDWQTVSGTSWRVRVIRP
jgi:4-amino-4-deoxy-L-arabinose transferase-like glycosyltransferase